eukprot:11075226-Lingulodinium_polyedra.AAC.1
MSEYETHCKEIEGLTLEKKLCNGRREWVVKSEIGKRIALSQPYYQRLRVMYQDSTAPDEQL